jgi:SAM-dependent methyltransferase
MPGTPIHPPTSPPPNSVDEFYQQVRRSSLADSNAQKRRELTERGATYWIVRDLGELFPTHQIGRVLEVGGEYAPTLTIVAGAFAVTEAVSCDLVVPAQGTQSITYLRASIEHLAARLQPRTFDVILLIDVIEHLYDPDAALDEIRQLLSPDGVLVLVTPNLTAWFNRLMFLLGLMPFSMEVSTRGVFGRPGFGQRPVGHIRVFTVRAMREFLRASGFEVVRLRSARTEFVTGEGGGGLRLAGTEGSDGSPAPPGPSSAVIRMFGWVDRAVSSVAPSLGSRMVVFARPIPKNAPVG